MSSVALPEGMARNGSNSSEWALEEGLQKCRSSPSRKFESGGKSASLVSFIADTAQVVMNDLRFSVNCGRSGRLEILRGINAHVQSGEVLAIMGGSGAGKTTLLDTLVLANRGGHRSGTVTINGKPLDCNLFRTSCTYVAQKDVQNPALTVRETMNFAAALYRGRETLSQRNMGVDALLEQTGLASCADVLVGDELIKGISGGQRRRLSVAVELLKRQSLLVLDEPTSGLDSAAAEAIMDLLRKVAHRNNLAIICTIHQPSSYLYQSFAQLLLLAKGRVCYFGAAQEALEHFERIGFPSPCGVNPAEFLIRITNPDFCSEKQVADICDAWSLDEGASSSHTALSDATPAPRRPRGAGAPACAQLFHLFVRAAKGNTRNPSAFLGRILISSVMVSFICFAYSGVRHRTQDEVIDRMWICMWIQQLPAFFCVGAVPAFSRESMCFRKEVKNGLYAPLYYFLADCLVMVPFWFILSITSILPAFVILDLNWSHILEIWLLTSVYVGHCDTVAQLCGTAFESTTLGVMAFIGQTIVSMIFNGTLLARIDTVSWALRWLFYVVPSKYSFRSAVRLEFDGLTFGGFDRCLDAAVPPLERAVMSCWGETGTQIVNSLSMTMFPVLTTDNTLAFDVALIVAELLALKLVHMVFLEVTSR